MWIHRDISNLIKSSSELIQIIRGPRQCGKSSLIMHLFPDFKEVSLDSPALREFAQRDPELFLEQYKNEKLFIDEAQYCPALFSVLKRKVDLLKREKRKYLGAQYILTGSNQILMDKNVKESLAGRASYFNMNTLSVAEILRSSDVAIQEIIFRGGWPELYANPKDPKKYLDDYIFTYVEKDIMLSAGIQKSTEFTRFLKLLAGRIGEILDHSSFGRDVGVDSKTISGWLSILEKMQVISLCPPFYSNLSKRLIKSPKIYFIDTGLAVRLQGWSLSEPILTSPQQGHLFENLVYSEIYKLNQNYQLGLEIFHWRTKGGEEVDFLVKFSPNRFIFLEAKVSPTKSMNISNSNEARKIFKNHCPPLFQVNQYGNETLGDKIPISVLTSELIKKT